MEHPNISDLPAGSAPHPNQHRNPHAPAPRAPLPAPQPQGTHPLGCAREVRVRMLVRAGDPVPPPVGLLHSVAQAIHEHCGHTLLKAHRLSRDLSVERAVAAVHRLCREQALGARGLAERSWKHWESGEHPSADYQDILARLFQTNPVGLGFAHDYTPACPDPAPGTPPDVPPGHPGGPSDRIGRRLTMAADESAHLGDHPSNVGPLTLDRIRTDTRTLARQFANAPRLQLFDGAVHLRDRIFTLLDGRQRVSESRDLYFLAAVSLGMLAEATENLGYYPQAMTHARTGLLCAKEAGHPDLTAWLNGVQSMIAFWGGRPAEAAEYAQRGQDVGATGTVAVWLPAHEARAAAALGDRARTADALERARSARELVRPDVLNTTYGGSLTFSPAKEHYYACESWIAVGDGARTRQAAETAISAYQQGPAEERARDNECSAQANIARAYVLDDDLDAAETALARALELPADLRIASFDQHLRRLHGQVSQARFAGSAAATGIRDRIETHLATPTPALPPG